MQKDVFVDPSLAGPDVLFSTGQVANGEEQFDPTLPDITGAADPAWNVTQWSTPADQIFDPGMIVRGDPADTDSLLGAALASWHTGDSNGGSTFAVYGGASGTTFRLGASGGGNKDTFLQSTGYASGAVTFDHQISFTAQERLVTANAGNGTAIAFNGFTVFFNAADNPSFSTSLPQTEMFLQVPLTDFRGEPGAFTTLTPGSTYQQIYNTSSWSTDPNGGTIADESSDYLAFAADDGALHDVAIDLNQALLRMVRLMAAQNPSMASEYLDLSRWSLGSVYSGVETGGGDGADAASLTMDIAHPLVTRDDTVPVSSGATLSTVQSIDNGTYAESEDAPVIDTLAGATDTVRLTNADGVQVLTGNGRDTVLAGDGIDATLHGLGQSLTVVGGAVRSGQITVDGTAALSISGSFDGLSVTSDADDAGLSATVLSASLAFGGRDVSVSVQGQADAMLSGADATFGAGGGIVSLGANGATVDQNGSGTQTVFLNNTTATVTQTGIGSQVVAGQPTGGGQVALSGGAGSQTLWTGDSDATITADGTGTLSVHIQAGSDSSLVLGGEAVDMDVSSGTLAVTGSTDAESARLSVGQGAATIQGGEESLVASLDGGGGLQVTAGSGSQIVFGGPGSLLVIGSHDAAGGTQLVVNGSDATQSTIIFGGLTRQTIWTGNASDTIVSSTESGDASGRIDAIFQGGVSSYWGGIETASLQNLGGTLDAFLNGDGAVGILADMTAHTDTVLAGFDSRRDSLTLGGLSDPAALHVTQGAGGTLLSFDGSQVMLQGLSHPTLTQTGSGISVSGWS